MSTQNVKLHKGSLLVSEPMMVDNYFKRSVVIITEKSETGFVGFILNKVVDMKINEALNHFENFNHRLYFGGPVQRDNIFYIHTKGEVISGSTKIQNGLYWGGDFEKVAEMVKNNLLQESDIKFFIGYSGWEPGQLEGELESESWIVSEANVDNVMSDNYKNLWGNVLKTMGNEFALLSNFPEHPQLN